MIKNLKARIENRLIECSDLNQKIIIFGSGFIISVLLSLLIHVLGALIKSNFNISEMKIEWEFFMYPEFWKLPFVFILGICTVFIMFITNKYLEKSKNDY